MRCGSIVQARNVLQRTSYSDTKPTRADHATFFLFEIKVHGYEILPSLSSFCCSVSRERRIQLHFVLKTMHGIMLRPRAPASSSSSSLSLSLPSLLSLSLSPSWVRACVRACACVCTLAPLPHFSSFTRARAVSRCCLASWSKSPLS